jgi:hypothetical protein
MASNLASQDFKQFVIHKVGSNIKGKQLTVEQFLDTVRKEVEVVRAQHPELDGFSLYDLKIKFPNNEIEFHMEFRR